MSFKNPLKHLIKKIVGINDETYVELGRDYPEIILKYIFTPRQFYRHLTGPLFKRQSSKNLDALILNKFEYKYHLNQLREYGLTILPEYFDKKTINYWKKSIGIKSEKVSEDLNYGKGKLSFDKEHQIIFENPGKWSFLKILSAYYGKQAFFRDGIAWSIVNAPKLTKKTKFKNTSNAIATKWHYDTPLQTTVHVMLSDRNENDPTTEFALKSHKIFRSMFSRRIDWFYSDKYVRQKYKTEKVYYKKGTVILFDSNILHRAFLGKGGRRENLHINFTPGNHFKPSRDAIVKYLNRKDIIKSSYWLSSMGKRI
tara:strand:- start:500 stop:1435 length:936 start_codon:yes stop_codon:yes gene_type:complete